MYEIKSCNDVAIGDVYRVFSEGYSDYMVPMNVPRDRFFDLFFGCEGNKLDQSFIAYDEADPVGLVLGGVVIIGDESYLRCGTLCVVPEYRQEGIGEKLMEKHFELAKDLSVDRFVLEVIEGNHKAIKLYERLGYRKIYNIKYFFKEIKNTKNYHFDELDIQDLSVELVEDIRNRQIDFHMMYQNELGYIKMMDNAFYFGIRENGQVVSLICLSDVGNIKFIWTDKAFRSKGYGEILIAYAVQRLNLKTLRVAFTNSNVLEGFYTRLGFMQNELKQYEMYKYI